jgi:hypothetical protein
MIQTFHFHAFWVGAPGEVVHTAGLVDQVAEGVMTQKRYVDLKTLIAEKNKIEVNKITLGSLTFMGERPGAVEDIMKEVKKADEKNPV